MSRAIGGSCGTDRETRMISIIVDKTYFVDFLLEKYSKIFP
ncbi:hypothetical protein M670_02161 [Schinkia azotoformans MEV2011]|uniref:Uncharacterized protein n=1 Tax=Schinkia azotoformans MEV2011 TaxID=1348973 RepID=A0A072NZ53_SCHAZ|nr:hypothetical protein [Schinkia azotoformans]KEF38535.1 hypothetical protein M670_02161 [Schinkia azotoformans MEV2011]MEC1639927.1 hypothetical protein [Schinkia azotoformans]MEC1695144.1 hypothetical protein [Schinkia azotoformans]MEC1717611.1 hypothetical protein [Schinkia azotoformans]MEC1722934.1 hypothetical protein [Schinkia azotoformans]